MCFRRLLVSLVFLELSSAAYAENISPPVNASLEHLQRQFGATAKDLVRNMRVVSANAPQCSLFGGAISSALAPPLAAIPPGAAKIDASLTRLKTDVAAIAVSPADGVDLSSGAALAVRNMQKRLEVAIAAPERSVDDVIPVVARGLRQLQENYTKVMEVLKGGSPPCRNGAAAFRAVYADSLAAHQQLRAIRSALEGQKAALVRWTQGVQGSLVSNN